jgi:hypothetical protein
LFVGLTMMLKNIFETRVDYDFELKEGNVLKKIAKFSVISQRVKSGERTSCHFIAS